VLVTSLSSAVIFHLSVFPFLSVTTYDTLVRFGLTWLVLVLCFLNKMCNKRTLMGNISFSWFHFLGNRCMALGVVFVTVIVWQQASGNGVSSILRGN
jgi:hypothetical protein